MVHVTFTHVISIMCTRKVCLMLTRDVQPRAIARQRSHEAVKLKTSDTSLKYSMNNNLTIYLYELPAAF